MKSHLLRYSFWIIIVLINACSSKSTNSSQTPLPQSGAALEGEEKVNACADDISSEACYFRFAVPALSEKSSKLVIFFSGGEMGCDDVLEDGLKGYSKVLQTYLSRGYVAVCAGTFLTQEASGKKAYSSHSKRINKLITSILNSVAPYWNGKHLLYGGVSYGATATLAGISRGMILVAKGTQNTGFCGYDGIYDLPALFSFYMEPGSILSCAPLRRRLICERYLGGNCFPFQVTDSMRQDSLFLDGQRNFSAGSLPIKQWKLIECGSELEACKLDLNADIAPAEPIKNVCDTINSTSGYSCTFASYPKSSHRECPVDSTSQGYGGPPNLACATWFDEEVVKN